MGSSKNHYKEWERQHGATVTRPGQLLRQQRRRWAVVQKQERGLYLLDAELKDQMKYEGVKPNVWILPSKMSIYVTMVPSAEVEFYRKGSGAAANLEKGPDNLLTFRGSKVFETRPFDIDFIGEPRDLLVRQRQIGIFPPEGSGRDGKFSQQLSRDTFTHDIIPIWLVASKDGTIERPQNPLDITGHYNNNTLDANNSTVDDDKPHYTGAIEYAKTLGFHSLQNYDQDEQFLSPMRHLNTVCFQGHQLSWDSEKKSFGRVTTNTGHWGPNVYPGCRAVRNGENAFLKDMEYEKLAVGASRN